MSAAHRSRGGADLLRRSEDRADAPLSVGFRRKTGLGKRWENATETVEPAVWSVRTRTSTLVISTCPHTVLIVDDHGTFRATARILLEAEGFQVVGEAEDGATAVMEACRLRPDLVLLDVQLPDTDGFHVADEITRYPNPPAVILVSSHDSSDFGSLISQLARPRLRAEGRAVRRARHRAAVARASWVRELTPSLR